MQLVSDGRAGTPRTIGPWAILTVVSSLTATALVVRPEKGLIAPALALTLIAAAGVAAHRIALAWRTLLTVEILVILWIPIRRYELPSALPFNLDLYRIVLVFAATAWLTSLLIDRRVTFHRSVLDAPLLALAVAYSGSILFAWSRLNDAGLGASAAKAFSLFLGLVVLFYFTVSVVRHLDEVESLIAVLAGAGAVVAFFSLVEAWTKFNVFNHVHTVFPFLTLTDALTHDDLSRGGHLRVYASAQHPIPLSALLVMLIPFAIYLAKRREGFRWWIAAALLLIATLATLSRTAIVMLAVLVIAHCRSRPGDFRRLLSRGWIFILPSLLAVHLALPGTLGTLKDLFVANGGVVAQQSGGPVGSGRLASLKPGLEVVARHPITGLGYGTRIVDSRDIHHNSFIVDDGWLSTAMEAGLAGVAAWVWLFGRFVRRLHREAKVDPSLRGELLAAFSSSVAAFAVGMLTYDALSFMQTTLVLFFLLALGSVALRGRATEADERLAPPGHLRDVAPTD
jgi:hypothetical protein